MDYCIGCKVNYSNAPNEMKVLETDMKAVSKYTFPLGDLEYDNKESSLSEAWCCNL